MRSIQSRNRNLGIQTARKSAKSIVRNGSDSPSPRATSAHFGFALHTWQAMGNALRQWSTTVTRVMKTRVTGGACYAVAQQRSGRHDGMCRLAAR